MRLTRIFLVIMFAVLFGVVSCTKNKSPAGNQSASGAHEDPDGYYTCPMHPQVHTHEPGPCPICGMALVKVKAKSAEVQKSEVMKEANQGIIATPHQLGLIGVGKFKVTKRDLQFTIPVSGRLVSPSSASFQVFESDLGVLKAGAAFEGRVSTSPGEQIKGRVSHIDSLLDPSSRTVRVTVNLSSRPERPVVDGAIHGEIKMEAKNQIAVPEDAVLRAGTRDLVYVYTGENEIKPQPVVLGARSGAFYQIHSGLNEGDEISSGANFLLDSEAKIRGSSDQTHH